MRFLHLSDLHLGKRVCEFSMLDDQRYILEQILSLLDSRPVDAVLLAPRFGLVGVWFAMCTELCTRGALFLLRLARGKWLDKGALA